MAEEREKPWESRCRREVASRCCPAHLSEGEERWDVFTEKLLRKGIFLRKTARGGSDRDSAFTVLEIGWNTLITGDTQRSIPAQMR